MRALLLAVLCAVAAHAAPPPPPVAPPAVVASPWITYSCWIEVRWFETLRSGPLDYCKRGLRFRPNKWDCLSFTDEVCWSFNQVTGDWLQLRNPGRSNLVVCPPGPEPPTCPRLRLGG